MSAYSLVGGQEDTQQQLLIKDNFSFSELDGSEPSTLLPTQYASPPPFYSELDYHQQQSGKPLSGQTIDTRFFQQDFHQPAFPLDSSGHVHLSGRKQDWLQQQQLIQYQASGFGIDPQSSRYHPSYLNTLPQHQQFTSAYSIPLVSSETNSRSNIDDGSSTKGIADSSHASSHSGYDTQQGDYTQASSLYSQSTLGHRALQHGFDHQTSDLGESSSLVSSKWNPIPQLNTVQSNAQGHHSSTHKSVPCLDTMSKRRKGKQSRSQLQNHLQSLRSEMVTLTERVRIAQEDCREKSSPEELFISDGKRAYDLEKSSASSSYFPETSHRRLIDPFQFTSSISSTGAQPPARGTWKKEDGKVLIFSPANNLLRPKQLSYSKPSSKRSISEQSYDDENEECEGEMRTNEGSDKRYKCPFDGCEKSFTTSGHARRHGRCHNNRKVFICPHQGCNSAFTRRDNCRQHQRARHHLCLPVLESTEETAAEESIQSEQ